MLQDEICERLRNLKFFLSDIFMDGVSCASLENGLIVYLAEGYFIDELSIEESVEYFLRTHQKKIVERGERKIFTIRYKNISDKNTLSISHNVKLPIRLQQYINYILNDDIQDSKIVENVKEYLIWYTNKRKNFLILKNFLSNIFVCNINYSELTFHLIMDTVQFYKESNIDDTVQYFLNNGIKMKISQKRVDVIYSINYDTDKPRVYEIQTKMPIKLKEYIEYIICGGETEFQIKANVERYKQIKSQQMQCVSLISEKEKHKRLYLLNSFLGDVFPCCASIVKPQNVISATFASDYLKNCSIDEYVEYYLKHGNKKKQPSYDLIIYEIEYEPTELIGINANNIPNDLQNYIDCILHDDNTHQGVSDNVQKYKKLKSEQLSNIKENNIYTEIAVKEKLLFLRQFLNDIFICDVIFDELDVSLFLRWSTTYWNNINNAVKFYLTNHKKEELVLSKDSNFSIIRYVKNMLQYPNNVEIEFVDELPPVFEDYLDYILYGDTSNKQVVENVDAYKKLKQG